MSSSAHIGQHIHHPHHPHHQPHIHSYATPTPSQMPKGFSILHLLKENGRTGPLAKTEDADRLTSTAASTASTASSTRNSSDEKVTLMSLVTPRPDPHPTLMGPGVKVFTGIPTKGPASTASTSAPSSPDLAAVSSPAISVSNNGLVNPDSYLNSSGNKVAYPTHSHHMNFHNMPGHHLRHHQEYQQSTLPGPHTPSTVPYENLSSPDNGYSNSFYDSLSTTCVGYSRDYPTFPGTAHHYRYDGFDYHKSFNTHPNQLSSKKTRRNKNFRQDLTPCPPPLPVNHRPKEAGPQHQHQSGSGTKCNPKASKMQPTLLASNPPSASNGRHAGPSFKLAPSPNEVPTPEF